MAKKVSSIGRYAQLIVTCLLALGTLLTAARAARADDSSSPREKLLLDFGWKFYLGDDWGSAENLMKAGISVGPADTTFCDAAWRSVNLPHDWAVELPFDSKGDHSHGYKTVGKGYPENSVGWYRRAFQLSKADAGKRIWLELDGAYRDCLVFLNGYRIARQESGYSSFRYDVTDYVNDGANTLAIRVDASKFEGWFYEGAGIYRHVWLEKTSPLAISPDGIFVYSQFPNNIPTGPAELHVKTKLLDSQDATPDTTIHYDVIGPDGQTVATFDQPASVQPWLEVEAKSVFNIANPVLWSPESPALYKLVTTVQSGGQVVDRKETEFGIRTFDFDANKGFLLNGKPYVIKGTCNHQDHAGVGSAMPDALQYFRVARLKDFGCNAIRTSHNPPTPELLEACDRLGMLVMDENRLLGSTAENMALLQDLVRRDRNHASVFIWSIANEEHVQALPAAGRMAEAMQRVIHRLDPTRKVTSAVSLGDVFTGIDGVVDVRGWNYHLGDDVDDYHREHPNQPGIGSEQASTVTTRGIYTNDAARGYVTAYDGKPLAGQAAEAWWVFFTKRPWLSGGFVWTGFDYRGEPTPYNWPSISSQFGIVDTCGFPKDNFYYYQSWWSDKTVLHLLPHWNWPGNEGQNVDVRVYSNCEKVEVFLNGQSRGIQITPKNGHLDWQVKYAPGVLSAKGYRNGKVIAETKEETTGAPAAVQLAPDRSTINADGEDLSIITVAVADDQGRTVPTADNLIHFELNGPGKIIGVGNGDPSSHEPDVYIDQPATRTGTMNLWWQQKVSSKSTDLKTVAEKFNETRGDQADTSGEADQISADETAVFRAHLFVPREDLALTNIPVHFGAIKDDGWLYVNGKPAGESHHDASPTFNVRPFVHAGLNTIAVRVKCTGAAGGIGQGVSVEFDSEPAVAHWQRSTFNGLAQVIVQSTKEPGTITLTASGDGLTVATLNVTSQACVPRPSLP
jgi:beta-galactosidase